MTSEPEVSGEDNILAISPTARVDIPIRISGRGNRLTIEDGAICGIEGEGAIRILGENNTVRIGGDCRFGIMLTVDGAENSVDIGRDGWLAGRTNVFSNGSTLKIGDKTTMVEGSLQLHETSQMIIGEDCMISRLVYLSVSDIHPIYDRRTGERINPARPIHIGDHVWLGMRSIIMKGARVGDGAIVAAGALVSGEAPAATIMAGAPARVLREGVVWRRNFGDAPPDAEPALMTGAAPQPVVSLRRAIARWTRGLRH